MASSVVVDALPTDTVPVEIKRPHVVRRLLRGIAAALDWLFGAMSLIVGLSIVATLPIVQLASLGYLLEVSGRIARERRLRAGFVGIDKAARIGRVTIGITLLMIPLWIVAALAADAVRIDPTSRETRLWRAGLIALSLVVLLQIISAMLRGGKLRHFFWPRPIVTWRLLRAAGAYARARDAVWDVMVGLRLPYYFWLGLRGFAGALVWLAVPVSILAAASRVSPRAGGVTGFVGGVLLMLVLVHLPFLQARFAEENRLGAMFELRALRQQFVRAPLAFLIALVATLLLALPLYLLKIEIVPREAAWLPSLLFVTSIFPARMLTGWALARANRRERPRLWLFRWLARLAMIPAVGFYVLLVYFTQYLSWYGVWSLYEQHAFLVPVPFLGL